ncbi:hypothetical protein V8J82_16950 [Gymnodinialimonas sp. 2305UL16-5]|uniref:hypothetical protein n=1 Tax=Gymnodinialimonas mytili TaxID=3126503 RepID=UPI003094D405
MAQTVTGVSIFFGALGDVFRNLPVVARIIALPLALYLALEVPMTRADIADYESFEAGFGGAWLFRYIVFLGVVGIVSVSWHRYKLLGEVPKSIVPPWQFGRWWRYALAWLVLGLIVGFWVALLVAAPLFIAIGFFAPDLWDRILGFGYGTGGFFDFADPVAMSVAAAGLSMMLFTGLFFTYRLQTGLPAIAIERADGFNMTQSWRQTAPLGAKLLVTALLATVGQAILIFVPEMFLYNDPAWSDPAIPYSFSYMYFDNVVVAISDVVLAIFGAAILARIYEAIQLADDPVAVF